jgi:hypothetical protein
MLVTGDSRNGLPTPGKVDMDILVLDIGFLSTGTVWPRLPERLLARHTADYSRLLGCCEKFASAR